MKKIYILRCFAHIFIVATYLLFIVYFDIGGSGRIIGKIIFAVLGTLVAGIRSKVHGEERSPMEDFAYIRLGLAAFLTGILVRLLSSDCSNIDAIYLYICSNNVAGGVNAFNRLYTVQ